jgi:hypothetical protein
MKPDVLEQIKQIEADRQKQMQQGMGGPNGGQLMINEEGKPPRPISNDQIITIVNQQLQQIKFLTERNQFLESVVQGMQAQSGPIGPSLPPLSDTTTPTQNPLFVETLLKRIEDLEQKLADATKASASPSVSPSVSPSAAAEEPIHIPL